ncbi:hypothetical protein GCM10027440_37570 [Nocardiopsis coralliicola]
MSHPLARGRDNAGMDANTGQGPLQGVDDVDWAGLAPERGTEIPGLLRTVAAGGSGSMDAVSTLFDILRHPGPGYLAAPEAARFLTAVAAAPDTAAPGEALSLLLELAVPLPTAEVPSAPEVALWQDEAAWAVSADRAEVRAQYLQWRDDAPDEQTLRRMSARYDALSRDAGAGLVQAEFDVRGAIRERVGDLLPLMEGRDHRLGLNSTAEWTATLLAFFPEERDRIVPAILRGRGLLEVRDDDAAPAPGMAGIAAAGMAAQDAWRKPLTAELFALGMLAEPEDADTTVALAREMAGGNLYAAFAAASALAMQHGERVPQAAVERMRKFGRTRVGFTGLFSDSWPHIGDVEPVVLGYLALGRSGAATVALRAEMLPAALEEAGPATAAVAGAALESVLGPRSAPQDAGAAVEAAGTGADGGDPDALLQVLWAIAEIPAATWDERGVGEVAESWALPADRADFRAYAGVADDAPGADEAGGAAGDGTGRAPAASAPQPVPAPGGLLGRLFGGR